MNKPILCLDFDGVLHSYTSGWKGADVIPDPPVEGAMEFLCEAVNHFEVHIFSSRSDRLASREAMQDWIARWLMHHLATTEKVRRVFAQIEWPTEKPPAMVTIDDRAITFTGTWPAIEDLKAFRPWNKQ